MNSPTPLAEDELRRLGRLIGHWRGQGTLTAGGQIAPVQLDWTFAACAGGHAVEGSLLVLGIPGVDRCEQKDLIAFDRAEQKIRWVSSCNLPEFHDRRGSLDGSALVVSDPKERIRVQFLDDDRLSIEIAADGMTAQAVLAR
jgi:hypothetical protein